MRIHNGGAANAWQQQCATIYEIGEKRRDWTVDREQPHQAKVKATANGRDSKQDGGWACRTWQPVQREIQAPALPKPREFFAAGVLIADSKRVTIDKVQPSGDVEKIRCRIVMNELHLCVYGATFFFRKMKGRGNTAFDSRSGKRVNMMFVSAELRRMCGVTLGDDLYNQLIGS
jgi:hypothetical protein